MSRLQAWSDSPRIVAWRRRWLIRGQHFTKTEVVASSLIIATWAIGATVAAGWLPLVLMAVGIGLWVHLAAVETGSHIMMWLATALVLGFVVMAGVTLFTDLSAVSYSMAGVIALAHNELIRLNHARRRQALIDEEVYFRAGTGMGMVAVVTVGAIAVAEPISERDGVTWWWMPLGIIILLATAVALAVLPARKAPPSNRHRWRPGDRIPPQPLGNSEQP